MTVYLMLTSRMRVPAEQPASQAALRRREAVTHARTLTHTYARAHTAQHPPLHSQPVVLPRPNRRGGGGPLASSRRPPFHGGGGQGGGSTLNLYSTSTRSVMEGSGWGCRGWVGARSLKLCKVRLGKERLDRPGAVQACVCLRGCKPGAGKASCVAQFLFQTCRVKSNEEMSVS